MTESSKPSATTSVALLSIQANGMKSVRYGRDTMPADAFYQVENRAGKVIARSSMLAALNPSWPPLEFEVQGGRNRKISLVFYDYNPKKPRRSFEIACIETNMNELYEAVAAHKKNKDKPSYSLPSFGLEVYICDLEEKDKIPQLTPDLADDMTTASSISNPLVPILEDEEEEDDHEEIRSTDKYDVVNNNNFIGLVDETESIEKNDSSAAINNRKDQEKEEAVTFVVGNKFLSPTMCQQLESKAPCSSNSTLSSDSSNSTLDPITENKSDANCDGSKIVQDANTSTGKKLPSSSLTGYDEEDDGGNNKEQTVAATPLSAVVTGSHKNEDFDPCKAEKEEDAIAVLVENNFLVSKQRLPSAKNHGCDSSFTSNSSFTSTEVDTFAEQESRNHNEDRESREDSISRLQKSPSSTVLSGRYQDGACAELKLPITSPSTLITGSYQHEDTNYEDFDVSISSSQEECAQSSILAGRFRQEPDRDDADINSMDEDEELVSDSSYSDDEGDCDQQLHCNWKIHDENLATPKQPPSRTTPEGEERQMIELHILATGISSSSSDNLNTVSTYYYEVENEAGDAIGRSSLTATCSEKKAVCHLDFHALCGGNADRRISLVFYHNSKEIACIETSMTELHRATKAYQLQTNEDDKRESFGIDGDDDDPNINEFKVFICHVANTSDNGNMLVPEKEHKVISSPLTAADQMQKSFRVKNKFWRFKKFINKKKHFDN
mmetsp:Transcript_31280/g.46154  ORF Transcript_31280/g.46154 Transcript_31280/m.46154 type:complete len:724 (+) Transcript_31280:125-2296(+)|eukprot:CAMPEP_0194217538 /NCGR_PEP_ID=MMETSP0156-20130528/21529_1 /TAXON_ID=33649 /ORGANISM="Thalassionema nitzschioides, Strain L26-B" /LENGTH=723 /DNA_ID=CAMNT_0038946609 /DNA_START=90 /DNA_END=2261 /DNA_ORIENTATION=-